MMPADLRAYCPLVQCAQQHGLGSAPPGQCRRGDLGARTPC